KKRNSSGTVWRDCRRCGGSGKRRRLGKVLIDAATSPREEEPYASAHPCSLPPVRATVHCSTSAPHTWVAQRVLDQRVARGGNPPVSARAGHDQPGRARRARGGRFGHCHDCVEARRVNGWSASAST